MPTTANDSAARRKQGLKNWQFYLLFAGVIAHDLGKLDEDGYVVFVGRMKRLIIISGYNVYPNDLEKLLTDNLPYIRECCAVQGYDENARSLVRLYIVTADGETAVYDPGMGDFSTKNGKIKNFGLLSGGNAVYNENIFMSKCFHII